MKSGKLRAQSLSKLSISAEPLLGEIREKCELKFHVSWMYQISPAKEAHISFKLHLTKTIKAINIHETATKLG